MKKHSLIIINIAGKCVILLSCFLFVSCISLDQMRIEQQEIKAEDEALDNLVLQEDDGAIINITSIPYKSIHSIYPKGDEDYFKVDVKDTAILKIQRVEPKVEGVRPRTDRFFKLYDSEQNNIAIRWPGEAYVKPGTYYINVSGEEGPYALRVSTDDPKVRAAQASASQNSLTLTLILLLLTLPLLAI